jgi:heme/copper-type cytochrome/quinol oxidase subunit 2
MLLIIVPVMILIVCSRGKYREAIPRPIRAGLGSLDQARTGDLGRAAADHHRAGPDHLDLHPQARPVPSAGPPRREPSDPAGVKPLEMQVVAMDWKWLFIYPEQGIATVNELVGARSTCRSASR